jgi:hypothetical protein
MAEQTNPKPEREIDLEHEMVDDAFRITPGGQLELPKRILAVAYLLETSCDEGNGPLDGAIADGLAQVLRGIAKEVAMLRRRLRRQDES